MGGAAMTGRVEAFDAQGHRGARGLVPENTLAGFARALTIGVDTLELDTGVSKDGVVVVSHNPHLEPNIVRDASGAFLGGTGPALKTLTVAELKTYDVGRINPNDRYAKHHPDQVPVDGQRIPTLEEVIELVNKAGNDTVRLNIETKIDPRDPDLTVSPTRFAELLVAVLRKHGFENRVTIQSFDWRTLLEVQKIAPEIVTAYLTARQDWYDNIMVGQPGKSPWLGGLDIDDHNGSIPAAIRIAGGKVWSPFYRDITAKDVEAAHAAGLKVKVWTVNRAPDMEKLIDMGVDGIITDYPDRLRAVMEKRGMTLPKETPVTVE